MKYFNQSSYTQLLVHYEREYDQLMQFGKYYCIDKEMLKDTIHDLFLHFAEKEINLICGHHVIDNNGTIEELIAFFSLF